MKIQVTTSRGERFDPETEGDALLERAQVVLGGEQSETWQIEPVRQPNSPKGDARPIFAFVVKEKDHAETVIRLCDLIHHRFWLNCPGFCCGKIASVKDYAAVKRWLNGQ
jgi:hypothetical protein